MVCSIYSDLSSAQLLKSDNGVLNKKMIFSKVDYGFSYLSVFPILDNLRNNEKFRVSFFFF